MLAKCEIIIQGSNVILSCDSSIQWLVCKLRVLFSVGWSGDMQMSPRKALRAAMLKSRFADTIFRATHPTVREHVMILSAIFCKFVFSD